MNPDALWKLAALATTVGTAWLLTYAVHSTALIGAVWGAERAGLIRGLRVRDLAWRTALVGGLVTATLQLAAGLAPWGGLGVVRSPSAARVLQEVKTPPPPPAPTHSDSSSVAWATRHLPRESKVLVEVRAKPPGHPAPGRIGPPSPVEPPATPPSPPAALTTPRFEPSSFLFMGWAAMASVLLLRLALVRARVLTALGQRKPVVDPLVRARLEGLCHDVAHPRPVALTTAAGLRSPVALGWSEICLPAQALVELDADQQRSVMAHELAHLRRLDPVWLVLGSVLEQLFFFQPLNRLARARVQEVAEYLCDDWAAARDGSGLAVARGLATVASWLDGREATVPLAGMAEHPSQLLTRVQRLLQHRAGEVDRLRAWHLFSLATLLLLVVLAAPGVRAAPDRLALGATARRVIGVQAPDTSLLDGSPPLPSDPGSTPPATPGKTLEDPSGAPDEERCTPPDSKHDDSPAVRPSSRPQAPSKARAPARPVAGKGPLLVMADTPSLSQLITARVAETVAPQVRNVIMASTSVASVPPVAPIPPVAAVPPVPPVPPVPAVTPGMSSADHQRMIRDAQRMAHDAERRARDAVRRAQARVHGRGHHGRDGVAADPKTVDALIAALKDGDPGVRQAAAESLGRIGDPRAVEPLGQLVSDGNPEVRRVAVEALGGLEDPRVIPALSKATGDANPAIRREAAEALLSIEDPAAMEPLVKLLSDSDAKVRVMALEGLSRRQDRRALAPLSKLIKDPNVEVRTRAVRALARFHDPAAQEALVTALKDESPEVRATAAEALGELQLRAAPQGLLDASKDSNPDVRQAVAQALGGIRDAKAVPQLRSLLEDSSSDVREAAVQALSEIRDASALQALITAMQSKDVTVRRAAAEALGQRD